MKRKRFDRDKGEFQHMTNISIEHAAIYTRDLERLKTFYQTYFNAESNEKYQNKTGFSSYFLTFQSGAA